VHPSPGPQGPSPAIPDLPPIDLNDQYEEFVPKPLPPPHGRLWVQVVLFLLTLVSTTLAGASHYLFYSIDFATLDNVATLQRIATNAASDWTFYVNGLWYSLTILAILGCHEMGHYVACLRYNVVATRPYFLPVPIAITGTFGAFIRIKSRIPNKAALFDIGIAGPIAGFVVAVPALFIGLMMSRVDQLPVDQSGLVELGEPLLFKLAAWMIWGNVADGSAINMHPMAFAAWFGLLATALNLFPISQLDGGHIAYAVLGRRSTILTFVALAVAIALAATSINWVVWTGLLVLMIVLLGPHHPPTLYDDEPVSQPRVLLALFAVVMLVVCFTPVPIGEILGTPR
jgi:membrane-associated protease RseP (regulator of RpoE activity)